jgi:hypothetical protein
VVPLPEADAVPEAPLPVEPPPTEPLPAAPLPEDAEPAEAPLADDPADGPLPADALPEDDSPVTAPPPPHALAPRRNTPSVEIAYRNLMAVILPCRILGVSGSLQSEIVPCSRRHASSRRASAPMSSFSFLRVKRSQIVLERRYEA